MSIKSIIDKKRLLKQKYRLREIKRLEDRISIIDISLSGPGGMKITDMPRNQKPFNKLDFLVQEKIEKEKKLEKLYPIFKSESIKIVAAINDIEKLEQPQRGTRILSDFQTILRLYYLEDKSWEEILEVLNLDSSNDSNLRSIHNWHGKALKLLHKAQN